MSIYPVFSGSYHQRGYGSPSLWLRTLKPLLKKIGLKALQHGSKLGTRVYKDVSSGQGFKDSLKARSKQTISEILRPLNSSRRNNIKRKRIGMGSRKLLDGRRANYKTDIFSS